MANLQKAFCMNYVKFLWYFFKSFGGPAASSKSSTHHGNQVHTNEKSPQFGSNLLPLKKKLKACIWRQSYRGRGRATERCIFHLLLHSPTCRQELKLSSSAFPGALAGRQSRNGAAGTWAGAQMGPRLCRRWLNTLGHNTDHAIDFLLDTDVVSL